MAPRTRAPRRSKLIQEPVVEVLEESGEDMEVSEEDMQMGGASSEQGELEEEEEEEQVDEVDEEEEEVEVDEVEVEEEEKEEEEEEEEEEEQEDELSSSTPSPSPAPTKPKSKSTPTKPRLKIKLKFSGVSNTNATPTPSDEMPHRPHRRGPAKHIESSTDSDDSSSRSASFAGPSRMTHRQAALAGMVEATELVSLEETASKKKKHLNEAELALKREETARKRKNLSVKKLEDEKAETINRLLKKQSRPRGKKSALAAVEDEEADPDAEDNSVPVPASIVPTTFRWISSSKPDTPAFTFSVPVSLLPEFQTEGGPAVSSRIVASPTPVPKAPPICDVSGCTLPRKYKLVKDPTKGGCGLEHLKALQVQ